MKRRVAISMAAFVAALSAAASSSAFNVQLRDSGPPQSQGVSKKSGGQESQAPDSSTEEHKKAKKVWTNDNLNEVSGSAVSQVGNEKDRSAGKSTAAKPANAQVAAFRKQIMALQALLANLEKQIADLKSFNKGEASSANGLQFHKRYTTEPVEDQVRKLEEKKKLVAEQIDTVFDAARKLGIEPGQLR
jgi:hypothetical protein